MAGLRGQGDRNPQGWRSVGEVAAQIVSDLRFRRRMEALHAKGARVTTELLAEVIATPLDRLTLDARLDRFLSLSDKALDAAGGRQLPPIPLHEIPSR